MGEDSKSGLRHLPWVTMAALVTAPLAGLIGVLVLDSTTPEALQPSVASILITPTLQQEDGAQAASLQFTHGIPVTVNSTGASGLVTAIMVQPGMTVRAGDVVYSVDGLPRSAIAGSVPPYRRLAEGARGQDVLSVEEWLSRSGHLEQPPDTIYDTDTAQALIDYASETGITPAPSEFTPDLVVWLPHDDFVIGTIAVRVGQVNPPQGDPVLTGRPPVLSASLATADGRNMRIERPVVVRAHDTDLGVVTDAENVPQDVTDAASVLITTRPEDDAAQSQGELPVTLRYDKVQESLTVPSSAVMTAAEGETNCVWVQDGLSYRPVTVQIIGGALGETSVAAPITDDQVLANPMAILTDALCPSR